MQTQPEVLHEGDNTSPFDRPYGRDQRVVTIGGGTGPFALLSRLKHYSCSITAIVSMADSGGSSGRLMDEFGQLPFGDLRQALVALSRKTSLWRDMFGFRFPPSYINPGTSDVRPNQEAAAGDGVQRGSGLHQEYAARQREVSGHNLGNLIISALEYLNQGDLLDALDDAQALLETAGRVLPVTLNHATLCAQLDNGEVLRGESTVDTRGQHNHDALPAIRRIFLHEDVLACEPALQAIRQADVIIIGPGDLYTSVLPNLLVRGVPEAIRGSKAQTVYISNLMTKHGETDGFRASDFVHEIHRYLGGQLDRVILHDGTFPHHLRERYAAQQQYPVEADVAAVRDLAAEVIVGRFLRLQDTNLIRHDADRLAQAIFASSDRERDMPSQLEMARYSMLPTD
jgi:uncharacterized cofD-like protein